MKRTHGTLMKWNDDRGFGFISPAQGNEEMFVHISAFPRDGQRPRLNELISYEIEMGPNGKLRAIGVMRPGQRMGSHSPRSASRTENKVRAIGLAFVLFALFAIGVYGYLQFNSPVPAFTSTLSGAVSPTSPATFKCDGRTMCSQMTSCAEALYFLQHCPNTRMDGNNDGEPCEQQWCN
jgi:cold shock CspA family protein